MKLTISRFALRIVLLFALLAVVLARAGDVPPVPPPQNANSPTPGQPEVRVAVVILHPMVMMQNGSLTGFSIDLWNAIAERLKIKTTYKIFPNGNAVEDAIRSNNVDLTPAAFITSARDAAFDFSYPTAEPGLQIMVRDSGATTERNTPLEDMLRLLFSRTTVEWLSVALLLTLVPAHVVWFLERRNPQSGVSNGNYFPGIFEAFFWTLSTLTTQGDGSPRQWLARSFAVLWMFAGVVFVASYTAHLTTNLTVERFRGSIQGPKDLPGKTVGALTGSSAADYLRGQNVQVKEFPFDQIIQALLDRKVDAVVAPSPLLLYYAARTGRRKVMLVGPVFNSQPLAIEMQLHSPLRKQIDSALIAIRDDGTYQRIYDKWFGGGSWDTLQDGVTEP